MAFPARWNCSNWTPLHGWIHIIADLAIASAYAKDTQTIKGRKAGIFLTDEFDTALLAVIQDALKNEGGAAAIISPKIGGATSADRKLHEADFSLSTGPSFLFDTVILLVSVAGVSELIQKAAAVNWARDAFGHLKVIRHIPAARNGRRWDR